MKCLICTLASGWYKKFAPIFEYTAKRANPGCDVKVFDKDVLFPDHPDNAVSVLRFCIPNKHFKGYDYIYFTDVDFVFLPHKTSLIDYFKRIVINTRQHYAGYRGPRKHKWKGRDRRMAGGAFMATQKWLALTDEHRKNVVRKCLNGLSYREKDEVYLQRITNDAGFLVPAEVGCFTNGERYNKTYRNLHLGDFKRGFRHRWENMGVMKRKWFLKNNVRKYLELLKDEKFSAIVTEARKEPEIDRIFSHVTEHLQKRGALV